MAVGRFQVYTALENRLRTDDQGDIAIVADAEAVGQSIQNIISTMIGERVMRRDFGSLIGDLLFEPIDERTAQFIRMAIFQETQRNGEDRLIIEGIRVDPDYDLNQYDLTIIYRLKKLADVPFQFTRVLRSLGEAA